MSVMVVLSRCGPVVEPLGSGCCSGEAAHAVSAEHRFYPGARVEGPNEGLSAVDADHLAGQPPGIWPDEKLCDAGDVVGPAEPVQRDDREKVLPDLVREILTGDLHHARA